MISVFRKIRKKFFSNKASSYLLYAFGEIVLVMIGILLALQVNNWNEDRKKDKQIKTILTTVRTDLVTDTISANTVIKFYDSINKYSTKLINQEYDATTLKNCTLCRSLITVYQPFTIQDKGYTMLKNFDEIEISATDSLQMNILEFYKGYINIIDQSNEFVKAEALKNLDHFRKQSWFVDWMQGRLPEDLKMYLLNSVDYRNRVASNLILANQNHANFIRNHKKNAIEIIERIDDQLKR